MGSETPLSSLLTQIGAAQVYDLGRSLKAGMTCSPNHPGFHMALQRRHGDRNRTDGTSSANELVVLGGHVGTHIDALSHFSDQGLLHGGVSAADAQSTGSFTTHGVETIAPLLRRGVLLDVATAEHTDALSAAAPIDAPRLQRTAEQADVEVRRGDVVLIRTGWGRHFDDADRFLGLEDGAPGITEDAASWLAEAGVVAVGSDTTSVERIAPHQGHALLPVHRLLLVHWGVFLIEMLYLEELATENVTEFLFVGLPLKFVGGTGSPLRPVAVVVS